MTLTGHPTMIYTLCSPHSHVKEIIILTLILQKKLGREKLPKFSEVIDILSDGARLPTLVSLVKVQVPFPTLTESSGQNPFDLYQVTVFPNHPPH